MRELFFINPSIQTHIQKFNVISTRVLPEYHSAIGLNWVIVFEKSGSKVHLIKNNAIVTMVIVLVIFHSTLERTIKFKFIQIVLIDLQYWNIHCILYKYRLKSSMPIYRPKPLV